MFSSSNIVYALCLLSTAAAAPAANSKRGLAFSDAKNAGDISHAKGTAVSWVYDWGHAPAAEVKSSGLEYLPMQWNGDGIDGFGAAVKALGAKNILVNS